MSDDYDPQDPNDPHNLPLLVRGLATSNLGFFRNTVYRPAVTCRVCRTPVDGYARCARCNSDRDIAGICDRLAIVTYAWTSHQSGRVMYAYKGRASHQITRSDVDAVMLLSLVPLAIHHDCPDRLAGAPVTHWTTVPSLPRKPGDHPLRQIVAGLAPGDELPLLAATRVTNPRAVDATHYTAAHALPPGSHVLVIDDTWTTGAHLNSAALAARAAGASTVSALVLARWLDPTWPTTKPFIPTIATPDFDPDICPWTAGACPR